MHDSFDIQCGLNHSDPIRWRCDHKDHHTTLQNITGALDIHATRNNNVHKHRELEWIYEYSHVALAFLIFRLCFVTSQIRIDIEFCAGKDFWARGTPILYQILGSTKALKPIDRKRAVSEERKSISKGLLPEDCSLIRVANMGFC